MNEKRESLATIDRKKVSAMQSEYSNNRENGVAYNNSQVVRGYVLADD